MKIRKIKIENVRGISSNEISLDIHPNTPTFFVAPNGFGKTSIATTFKSLNRNRLNIKDEDRYQNSPATIPFLGITDDEGKTYYANNDTNTIATKFNVFVINSQLISKASSRNFNGVTATTPTLAVEPILLYKNIPVKDEFVYSLSDMKESLGTSAGKLLINLKSELQKPFFIKRYYNVRAEFEKLFQTRNRRKIDDFLTNVNTIKGSKIQIVNRSINTSDLEKVSAVELILDTFDYLFPHQNIIGKLVNVIQFFFLYNINKAHLPTINSYYEYLSDKNEINEMLGFFNCTWKNIKATKKGNQFTIEFPKATQISNGERDILCFVGKLFEARNQLRKDKTILIIDEIFDYLDDANLIAAQYFLMKFINQYKSECKELFPIILTHLDPLFFNTYSFSTKNVIYLDRIPNATNRHKINNLLKNRDVCKKTDPLLYSRISANYLHYSNSDYNDSSYLSSIGVEAPLQTPAGFRQKAAEELENYKLKREYDLALVCCGLRIHIEKAAYTQLAPEYCSTFSEKFTTIDKLLFAKDKGATIPEVHFLLSIVYNEAMHLDARCQKLHPIACKLRNKVIQSMISEI